MSRALDTSTLTTLNKNDFEYVYKDIASVLCPHPPALLEIEFLGKSHPLPAKASILVDENNVALPKAKLVQAFIYARRLFFQQLKPCPEDRHEDLFQATAVMLLMDPEHLTASNARKIVLKDYRRGLKVQVEAALRRELLFVDSYLTSRLHRHTKSPTLWSHRKWLLERFREADIPWDLGRDLKTVLTAAERHPRNYYAWLHLRWLVENINSDAVDGSRTMKIIKNWCLKHPSDTSGFSFLYFYAEHVTKNQLGHDMRPAVFSEVLNRTDAFKWTHESVWVFLRTLVASTISEEDRSRFEKLNTQLTEATQGDATALKILQTAMRWYRDNKRVSGVATAGMGGEVC